MKTIEEAAVEIYKENKSISRTKPMNFDHNEVKRIQQSAFMKCVEFAQRWIPIEEELPKNRDVVLTKVPFINYPILFSYNEIKSKWYQFEEGDFYESEIIPIAWRPIDRL